MSHVRFITAAVFVMVSASFAMADKPMPIWPDTAPGETGDIGPERVRHPKPGVKKGVVYIADVTKPTITVHKPAKEKDTGTAVVVCPGGGYNILAWDKEGEEVCQWLNSVGVTGVLLKYRVPRRKDRPKHEAPLQDAQRAIRIVRSKAEEWGIALDRIGILGFSAGGHLAASASTHFDKQTYEPIDETDKLSCRPDFAILIYPAYLVTEEKNKPPVLAEELTVTARTPATIILGTADDRHMRGAPFYYMALRDANVPVELHIYPQGGHGYGLRPSANTIHTWPKRCEDWMRQRGLLKAGG